MGEEMNKSIWSKDYWKGAAKRFSSVRMLAVCAMLLALRIAVGSVFIPLGDSSLRIYFTFFIIALGASVYGPLMAVVAGCAADLLSFAIAPSGPFFPGYTLSSMLGGLIYGLFLYRGAGIPVQADHQRAGQHAAGVALELDDDGQGVLLLSRQERRQKPRAAAAGNRVDGADLPADESAADPSAAHSGKQQPAHSLFDKEK